MRQNTKKKKKQGDRIVDSSSIELPGCEIEYIALDAGVLKVHFSRAYIIKTMTGSAERTKWWQVGDLIMKGATVEGKIPGGALVSAGGDVGENVYIYRDMIPLPLESRGAVRCDLRFRDTDTHLMATGDSIRMDMLDMPKYIEHLRPT